MALSLSKLLFVASCVAQVTVSGCATPQRLPAVPVAKFTQAEEALGPIRFRVTRETQSFATEARSALAKEQAWLASQDRTGPMPPANFLAVSGGGDNGAFGAGLLSGWTGAGTRPEFKAVTGISTGALIAPFAFLGPKYDYVLQKVYTATTPQDIFKKRGLLKGLFGDGLADTRPLASIIQSYVTPALLAEIAQEYGKGRLLLVGTTNLDTLEPVIWNMTAIAASKSPDAPSLFRSILLASASIPGAFPPVMIDVTIDGQHYEEMHVDGGTASQVFFYPPSLSFAGAPTRQRNLYLIRNARMDAEWLSVERRTLSIATRAIASLTRTQGVGDLYRIFTTTQRDGIAFNLAFIPSSFNEPHREEFDTIYMRALFDRGREMAAGGYPWDKSPPGYEGAVL
ncbi:MAG: patatin-like phospholipase family protein [Sphingomicrobium sp.]